MSVQTVVRARDVAPAVVPGHSFRVIADGTATGGAYSLTEATSPAGASVPLHAHDNAVECFFVLDGLYRQTVGGARYESGPGDFLVVPKGAPHQFEVIEGQARAVVIFAPAGFENVFRRMPEIFGAPGEPGPLWTEINTRFDTRLLAPDHHPDATDDALHSSTGALCDEIVLSLRSDPRPGVPWLLEPTVSGVWIVEGRYRFDGDLTLSEGEFASFDHGPMTAVSTAAAGRALTIHRRMS